MRKLHTINNLLRKSFLIFTYFFGIYTYIHSQSSDFLINKYNFKTIQFHKSGWPLSNAIMQLNSEDKLTLNFDELGTETRQFNYTLVLCNADWTESNLMHDEYMRGFKFNAIEHYQYSFNTTFDYINYQVEIPNKDVSIKTSGNYLIKVFEGFNETEPVLVRRFRVVEPLIRVNASVQYPTSQSLREINQQINFNLYHPNFRINNPAQELKVVVEQNGRNDNKIVLSRPQFIRSNELVYEYLPETSFEGGNEFRWLDIRSTRFISTQVKSCNLYPPYYHAELFPDAARNKVPYFYREDSNGKYIVSVREYDNPDTEADYLFVHFKLSMEQPSLDGEVYVGGGLTDWSYTSMNKMSYNFTTKAYELTLLLKQGFYNYLYYLVPKGSSLGHAQPIEGSFSQTENDYSIFVYYRGVSERHDRLVGFLPFNSLKPFHDTH
jgi:hypothetical protein